MNKSSYDANTYQDEEERDAANSFFKTSPIGNGGRFRSIVISHKASFMPCQIFLGRLLAIHTTQQKVTPMLQYGIASVLTQNEFYVQLQSLGVAFHHP